MLYMICSFIWQSAFWALWPDGGNRNRRNVPSGLKHTNVLICHSCVIHQPRTDGGRGEMSTNVCLANANDRREKETLTHASPPRGREGREITALFPGFLPPPGFLPRKCQPCWQKTNDDDGSVVVI